MSLGHLPLGQNHLINLNIQLATIMWTRPKEYPRILFLAGGGRFETHSAILSLFRRLLCRGGSRLLEQARASSVHPQLHALCFGSDEGAAKSEQCALVRSVHGFPAGW